MSKRSLFSIVQKLLLFILLLIIIGCDADRKPSFNVDSVQGTWVGYAVKLDKDFYKPYFTILEFNEHKLAYKNNLDSSVFERKISFHVDSIKLDTVAIPIQEFSVTKDAINFFRIRGHRLVANTVVDTVQFRETLSIGTWRTDQGTYDFENDGNVRYFHSNQDEYLKHCFEIKAYKEAVFLVKKGNQLSCDRDPQFVEQVLNYSEEQITVLRFENGQFKEKKYRRQTGEVSTSKPVYFQLCNSYINKNYPRDRYYYQGTEYEGGLYHIRKIFDANYKVPENSKESGIFQVRFVVNCEGKAGMFETQGFDYDYKLKSFSPEIADQILTLVKGLQDWRPGRNTKTNQVIDTYIYLSFRIKDGKIIRVYP